MATPWDNQNITIHSALKGQLNLSKNILHYITIERIPKYRESGQSDPSAHVIILSFPAHIPESFPMA